MMRSKILCLYLFMAISVFGGMLTEDVRADDTELTIMIANHFGDLGNSDKNVVVIRDPGGRLSIQSGDNDTYTVKQEVKGNFKEKTYKYSIKVYYASDRHEAYPKCIGEITLKNKMAFPSFNCKVTYLDAKTTSGNCVFEEKHVENDNFRHLNLFLGRDKAPW